MNVQNSKINKILTNNRVFPKVRIYTRTVRQRNCPATNLLGRPPQHRQVFV